MSYAIISISHGYEGDAIWVIETDASLLRVQRYCKIMGYTLIAYGQMRVFDEAEYMSSSDSRTGAAAELERRKEHRKWWESLTPEQRQQILYPQIAFSESHIRLWKQYWKTLSRSPVFEYKTLHENGG
ncbi:MAG: hypothetical protein K6T83_03645 [Alicyclobacillus sp.]|nr:hypothetical protein [Alicyclobacillus sp.]